MDDILRFVVTIAIYFVIFAVVGIAFYEVDKRFKSWVERRRSLAEKAGPAGPTGAARPARPAPGKRRR